MDQMEVDCTNLCKRSLRESRIMRNKPVTNLSCLMTKGFNKINAMGNLVSIFDIRRVSSGFPLHLLLVKYCSSLCIDVQSTANCIVRLM